MSLDPGHRLGPYEIVASLGAGGMGEVYRAIDTRLDREIALKILPSSLAEDDEALRRFRREAKSLAALHHPNIVVIHSVEEIEGQHLITMELVEGRTLDALIPDKGMELAPFLDLAIPLIRALAAAHDQNIVHRDLKPGNIMVTDAGELKILDFGLAKRQTSSLEADDPTAEIVTQAGMVVGTAPYMSPEQLQGQSVDARSDIFSLGIIFFEMLTGERPFAGESLMGIASSILRDEPQHIERIRPDVPPEIVNILHHCLAKDPSDRYGSLHEVLDEMRELAAWEGTESAPRGFHDTPSLQSRKFLIAAAVVMLISLATFWLTKEAPDVDGPVSTDSAEIRSLAVLPLTNLSPDPDQDYFADGMTEAIINDLARIGGLKVISRTSVMRYRDRETSASLPQIADELGVRGIIE
ncbi:MAG: serine/threonine-protein kinase, partial [Thermoanaerobaculia bacterium]|nr:serine/threonine-protein kinase [Thermoanaerobaculia bacterium]